MNLADLQAATRAYLLSGEVGALNDAVIADYFDAEERLRIYRSNFLISLTEALKANFPVTLQLVGTEFFEQAARGFIRQAPPDRPCLYEYGEGLAQYLQSLPELAALPYVAEMARFEFARIAASHAPREAPLTEVEMARIAPEALADLPIRLARHAQIVSLRYPVAELWQAHQAAEPDVSAVDMAARPHALLVCRPDRMLAVQTLDLDALVFLNAAREPTTLAQAADACGPDTDPDRLGAAIGLALKYRLLVSRA